MGAHNHIVDPGEVTEPKIVPLLSMFNESSWHGKPEKWCIASSRLKKSFFPAGINGHAKCFEYAPNDYESAGSGRLGNRTEPSECIAMKRPGVHKMLERLLDL